MDYSDSYRSTVVATSDIRGLYNDVIEGPLVRSCLGRTPQNQRSPTIHYIHKRQITESRNTASAHTRHGSFQTG